MTLTLILVLVPGVASAQRITPEEFMWSGTLSQGQMIEVKGINGDLFAEPATGNEVEVIALLDGRRDDPAQVEFEVLEHRDGITICAVYPSHGRRNNECRAGSRGRMNVRDFDVEVEFTVRVPAGIMFVGRTVNGDIDIRDLVGDAVGVTVNGDVDVVAAGTVEAHAVNGSIDAEMGSTDWTGELSFETVNGGIRLRVRDRFAAQIEASTVNGGFESDFPVTVRGRFGPRRISGEIGEGGQGMLRFRTVNGSISILRR
ncbi:MAG: DUF4097 domain-containing protein [Gemmatimonadales bacterium]